MSPENREQVEAMLDDNFENEIVAAIVHAPAGQEVDRRSR